MISTVITQSDSGYLPGTLALIRSVLETYQTRINFIVIDTGLTDSDKEQIVKSCGKYDKDVDFHTVDTKPYTNIKTNVPRLEKAFYKLEIFKIADKIKENVLFVDSDIVFLESIRPLLDHRLNTDVAMVYIDKPHNLWNSGVIVAGKGLTKKVFDNLKNTKMYECADQGFLNHLINQSILRCAKLDERYNVSFKDKRLIKDGKLTILTGSRAEKQNIAYAVHFLGPHKPWLNHNQQYEAAYELWNQFSS